MDRTPCDCWRLLSIDFRIIMKKREEEINTVHPYKHTNSMFEISHIVR